MLVPISYTKQLDIPANHNLRNKMSDLNSVSSCTQVIITAILKEYSILDCNAVYIGESSTFLKNTLLPPSAGLNSNPACHLFLTGFFLALLFNPENAAVCSSETSRFF
jgi:hypothetical protein